MHQEKGATAKAPRNMRQLKVRMAITSLIVASAALVGTSTPASAFYPPVGGGGTSCTLVFMFGQWLCE